MYYKSKVLLLYFLRKRVLSSRKNVFDITHTLVASFTVIADENSVDSASMDMDGVGGGIVVISDGMVCLMVG
jgi:hypothetical protein